jgi:hypothetical protein
LAVKTLAQIAGDENLSPDARIRASAELLNRGYGKPVEFREEHREQVTCEESGRSVKDMSQDEIDAEIEAILSRREERKAFQEQIGYKPPVKALMRS